MREAITSFTGEYEFLSNFYPSPIKWDGEWYPTAEHAYQAGKLAPRQGEASRERLNDEGGLGRYA